VAGQARPADAAEALALARLCRTTRKHSAAVRLYAAAFAADGRLAEDTTAGHRYQAACAAALAAAGRDADKLDPKERESLRRQARDWLRADLAQRARVLEGGRPADGAAVQQQMEHWRRDADLSGVRDADFLDRLGTEDRKEWQQLWADVTALLDKAKQADRAPASR
jgi:hypothetical protein